MLNLYKMKKAFTLVELLVVIAIMGILTMITVSQFQTAKRKANDVARKGDLNAVAKALQMYYTDYSVMPDMDNVLGGRIQVGEEVIPWGGEFRDAAGYVYMKNLPKENNDSLPAYCYKTDTNKKVYALFAMLENGVDSQCDRNNDGTADVTYQCGGKLYCFAYFSPNISLNTDGSFK
jgi:general secretion pathway protein G